MKGKIFLPTSLIIVLLLVIILLPVHPSQATGLLDGKSICLDPGHGGSDPGATNGELLEKSINLDVSFRLKELLMGEGAVVWMTREDDESYLTNSDRYTYCNNMQDENFEMILVSVHTNSVVDTSWDGAMTLYGPREDPDLAQTIHDSMYPYLSNSAPEGVLEFRDFGVAKFASGVLFKSDMPAAMVEPLFMSNSFEAPLLAQTIYDSEGLLCVHSDGETPCRREQIAQAVFSGIQNYFVEPQLAQMHVADIGMGYKKPRAFYLITTEVEIHDDASQPLSGATVEIEIDRDDELVTRKNIDTDEQGLAAYVLRSKLPGSYTATVKNVSKSGFEYDSALVIDYTLEVPE